VKVIEPVRVEDGAKVTDSTIGPNVVIGAGSVVTGCTLKDTIVGDGCTVSASTLHGSMIGNRVTVEKASGSVTLGDDAELRA
jgi:glucose-1-phosphate thymidylyltransferase